MRTIFAAVGFAVAASSLAQVQQIDQAVSAAKTGRPIVVARDCALGSIAIGQTVTGAIDSSDCNGGSPNYDYFDFLEFAVSAGQTLTATASAPSIDPILVAFQQLSDGTVLASNYGNSPVSVTYTFQTAGQYTVGIGSLNSFGFGNYTIALSAASGGVGGGGNGCGTSSKPALCLGNRFRVTASWQKSDGSNGDGTPITLTADTGYFWFFDSSNVEAVIKVLNACSFDSKYWVFASGLTNVHVELDVTDTVTGATKTYTNPQNTAFAPIQDTGALPCN